MVLAYIRHQGFQVGDAGVLASPSFFESGQATATIGQEQVADDAIMGQRLNGFAVKTHTALDDTAADRP